MNDPWFRMHANIADKPVVWRLASALKLSHAKAVGHLAMFWGKVSQHAPHGIVTDIPDAQLEAWAGWDGKRGAFADWLRAHHLTNGRVNEYDEYSGKLEERRERDRQRKAAQKRARPSDADARGVPQEGARNSGGIPAESRKNSSATIRDDTKRDEVTTPPPPAAGVQALIDRTFHEIGSAGRSGIDELLRASPDPAKWAHECLAALDGLHGVTLTPAQLAMAVHDFLGNGADRSLKLFRGYLRAAANKDPATTPRTPRPARPNPGAQGYANALAAVEDLAS